MELHVAIETNNWDEFEHLVTETSIDLNFELENETPLHTACFYGRLKYVDLLLDNGATLDSRNEYGHTPLHIATTYGRDEIIKLLVSKYQANILDKDAKDGMSLLHLACICNRDKVVQNLLDLDEGLLEMTDDNGDFPCHTAIRRGNGQILKILLDHHQRTNVLDKEKRTLLHLAAMIGNVDILEMLLNYDSTLINQQDSNGWTPLHMATILNRDECVELLKKAGASEDLANNHGLTPQQFGQIEELHEKHKDFIAKMNESNAENC